MKHIIVILTALASLTAQAQTITATPYESANVELHKAYDTAAVLNKIQGETEGLDPEAIKHYLGRFMDQAAITALVRPRPTPSAVQPNAPLGNIAGQAKATKPKPVKRLPPKPKGLEGLLVAHAQEAIPEIDFRASAILVANKKPMPTTIGQTFTHNGGKYELVRIEKVANSDGSSGHLVYVKNLKTGVETPLPWKLEG